MDSGSLKFVVHNILRIGMYSKTVKPLLFLESYTLFYIHYSPQSLSSREQLRKQTNCSNEPYKEEKQKCHQPSNIWLSKALLAPCNFHCSIRPRCLLILEENLLRKCLMASMISYLISVVLMQVMEIKVLEASNSVHMQKLLAYQTLKEGDENWKESNAASGRIKVIIKRREIRVGTSSICSLRECCLHHLEMGKTAHSLPSYADNFQGFITNCIGEAIWVKKINS